MMSFFGRVSLKKQFVWESERYLFFFEKQKSLTR